MSPIKNNTSNVSNGEFQLTPPPIPLHSPPKSDNETVNNQCYYSRTPLQWTLLGPANLSF